MNVGDIVTISLMGAKLRATVLEVEKYRGAYILRYRFTNGKEAYCTVFPELDSLPPSSFFTQEMYGLVGWLEWDGHLWPVPIKRGERVLEGVDYRLVMQRRIDLILSFVEGWEKGGGAMVEIMPNNEWEYEQWKKLGRNKGR